MSGTRVHIYLGRDRHRIKQEAARRGVSMSRLVQAALMAFLDADQDKREALVLRRFDRLSRQMGKIERDLSVLTETVALYIQYELAVTPPVPVSDQAAARAQAHERFKHFIERVARRMADGKSLINEVVEELTPQTKDFFQMDLGETDGE
ncbi:MAG: CopG family transcriptional regulator [Rhizobiaceae bacterium]|nr:CopG family transcriptional regulator [Rhizobiaceae bacterium]